MNTPRWPGDQPQPGPQQPAAGPAQGPSRPDGHKRSVKLSFTVEMTQSGSQKGPPTVRVLAAAPGRTAIGDKVRGWLHWSPRPGIEAASPGAAGAGPPADPAPEQPEAAEPATVNFWESLDVLERDALRSISSWRRFQAGEWLMREGAQADRIMVIIEGRTRVCVGQPGQERVLAERGPGHLIGERGGLSVSIRSASVIAVDSVLVMEVRTEDFTSFVKAHPRVFDIVENQVYDRLTQNLDRRQDDACPANDTAQVPLMLQGEHCTVLLSDVVGFGSPQRTDRDRRSIREALGEMTRQSLQGIPGVRSEDRGDGILTIVPRAATEDILERLIREIPSALARHNDTHQTPARFQLRIAVNVGPITTDNEGVSGEAIIIAARLADAQIFKDAIERSPAHFGVIASQFVYDTVIRHSANQVDRTSYSRINVKVKEVDTFAWMRLFNAPILVPHHLAPQFHRKALVF